MQPYRLIHPTCHMGKLLQYETPGSQINSFQLYYHDIHPYFNHVT